MKAVLHCAMMDSRRSRTARSFFSRLCSCWADNTESCMESVVSGVGKSAVSAAFNTAIRSMLWLCAAPMPCSKSRDATHCQSISWLSAFFGIDADHWLMSCLASVSQERPVFASFILCMVAERGCSTRRRPRKTCYFSDSAISFFQDSKAYLKFVYSAEFNTGKKLMLRKTIMFTKNTLFDCVHARCARSTTSRTKSFRHDDDADGAGNITRYNAAKDNLAKCKHGYVHTCVCRGEYDACAHYTGHTNDGMTKK